LFFRGVCGGAIADDERTYGETVAESGPLTNAHGVRKEERVMTRIKKILVPVDFSDASK
jgi:hypothetical protein